MALKVPRQRWLLAASLVLAVSPVGKHLSSASDYYEAGNPIRDRFNIDIGTYIVDTSTNMRLDGTVQGTHIQGTTFDVEHDLGYRRKDVFRLDAYWRFLKRNKLLLTYFENNRDATKSISHQLQYGELLFPVGATVDSSFKTQTLRVAYEFDFLQGENYSLGANIGIHAVKFSLDLAGLASAGTSTAVSASKTASATGPLPLIGIHGVWRLIPQFYLDGQVQYFGVSISPYSGHTADYMFSAAWQASKHVGLGAGYDAFRSGLTVDSTKFNGELHWNYGGARIFVTGSF